MQVETIYDSVKSIFTKPIRQTHDCFSIQMELPEDLVETGSKMVNVVLPEIEC